MLAAWAASPARFREDANAEQDLALGGYRDRLLVELAQNAADAAARAGVPGRLRLTLVDGQLLRRRTPARRWTPPASRRWRRCGPRPSGTTRQRRAGSASASPPCWPSPTSRRCARPPAASAFSAADTGPTVAAVPALAGELARRDGPSRCCGCPGRPTARRRRVGHRGACCRCGRRRDAVARGADRPRADAAARRCPGCRGRGRAGRRAARCPRGRAGAVVLTDGGAVPRWRVAPAPGVLAGDLLATGRSRSATVAAWTVIWAVPVDDDGAPGAAAGRQVVHAPTPSDEPLSLPAAADRAVPARPRPPARGARPGHRRAGRRGRRRLRRPGRRAAARPGPAGAGAAARGWPAPRWTPRLGAAVLDRAPRRRPGCRCADDGGRAGRPRARAAALGRRDRGAGRRAGRRAARSAAGRLVRPRTPRRSPRSACAGSASRTRSRRSAASTARRPGGRGSTRRSTAPTGRSSPRCRSRSPTGAPRTGRPGVLLPDAGCRPTGWRPLGLRAGRARGRASPGRPPAARAARRAGRRPRPPCWPTRPCARPSRVDGRRGRRSTARSRRSSPRPSSRWSRRPARRPGELPWLAELALPDAEGGLGAGGGAGAARLPAGRRPGRGRARARSTRTSPRRTTRTRCAAVGVLDTFALVRADEPDDLDVDAADRLGRRRARPAAGARRRRIGRR